MIDPIGRRLELNLDQARIALVEGIRHQLRRFGFQHAVLGLSGGIDSTLAAYLAAEAMGAENVLGVKMPYKTSSPESLADAQEVIDRLHIQSQLVEITPMVDPLFEQLPDMDAKRRGNAMARERMIVLYDRSEAFKALVIGTSNKTELLLGYGTLFGDVACAVNPLGDLYKTQVRALARHIGVPGHIIDKAPSADLWPGQTDEGEMGITYAEADRLLVLLTEGGYSQEGAILAGFSREFVVHVQRMVERNRFKANPTTILRLG